MESTTRHTHRGYRISLDLTPDARYRYIIRPRVGVSGGIIGRAQTVARAREVIAAHEAAAEVTQ